jgi:hypothetical protein
MLEKIIVAQLVKKPTALYGKRKIITVSTRIHTGPLA